MDGNENLVLREDDGPVRILRLNRPRVLNALNTAVMERLSTELLATAADEAIRVVVLTGNERAFAAGADIAEMQGKSAVDMLDSAQINAWEAIARFPKPLIGAVSGWALGGGLELALSCDLLVAAENARFGQPEINIGVMPGAGGTQRLARVVGKARAMELVLGGQPIDAATALSWGLVNRVVPVERCLADAVSWAKKLAAGPPVAQRLAKESVLFAFESPLESGLRHERRLFTELFATEDQKEGMEAFLQKRPPEFRGR
jgi:enoyl-CoA hydratase